MNGPESFSQGTPMAEKSPQPKWSQEEIDKGEDILLYIKKEIDISRVGSKYAQASIAAKALGFITKNQTFKNLPSSIKSYLEYVWWLESSEGRASKSSERIASNLAQMREDWKKLYMNNPDFRHAMTHPDDEDEHALH